MPILIEICKRILLSANKTKSFTSATTKQHYKLKFLFMLFAVKKQDPMRWMPLLIDKKKLGNFRVHICKYAITFHQTVAIFRIFKILKCFIIHVKFNIFATVCFRPSRKFERLICRAYFFDVARSYSIHHFRGPHSSPPQNILTTPPCAPPTTP